jgi:uncharacterized protein
LKDQLRSLLQLQEIDTKVKELEATITSLPARLEPVRRDLAKLESMLGDEKQRLADNESWKLQQESLLEREQEMLRQAKAKLSASRTGKEFNAATREVEHKKRAIFEREGEIKKMREVIEQTRAQVEAHGQDVESIRQTLAVEQGEVETRSAVLREEVARIAAGRAELRAVIDKATLKTYDALVTKRGYSVSPVVKGVCQGCHTSLPPQLVNILARGESLESCPRCGRIVYRPELIEDAPGSAAPPAAGEPPA